MLSEFKRLLYDHINKNSYKYFFLILCFCTGILCGLLFSSSVPEDKSDVLCEYVNNLCVDLKNGETAFNTVFFNLNKKTLHTTLLLSFCTLSYFFVTIIFVNALSVGFVTGFTVGFMSLKFGFEGFIVSAVSIIPELTVRFPITLLMSIFCLNYLIEKKSLHNRATSQKKIAIRFFLIFILSCLCNLLITPVITEFSKVAGGLIIR